MNLRAAMLKAAKEAGKIHRKYFQTNVEKSTKPDNTVVTRADKEAEEAIIKILRGAGYGILAEESGEHKSRSQYVWVIDPLDGTSNFSRGVPFFCVSIGLLKKGVPVMGVVYDPIRDELFFAEKGKGLTLNGKKIMSVPNEKRKHIFYDIIWKKMPDKERFLPLIPEFNARAWSDRSYGAAALAIAYVAIGRGDAYIGYGQSLWDLAAGMILATETGHEVSRWDGTQWEPGTNDILVAEPSYKKDLLPLLSPSKTKSKLYK